MASKDNNPVEMGTKAVPGCRHCGVLSSFEENFPEPAFPSVPIPPLNTAAGSMASSEQTLPLDGYVDGDPYGATALPPPQFRTSIIIGTNEGRVLQVPMYPIVKHSPVIRKLLYAYCENPKRIDPTLRLNPGFDVATLLRVVEWCNHHEDFNPAQPFNLSDMCDWDVEFLKMDVKSLLDVVKASYYLEIDGLGDLTCHGLAQMMEGKSPQQLREMFDAVSVFASSSDSCRYSESECVDLTSDSSSSHENAPKSEAAAP